MVNRRQRVLVGAGTFLCVIGAAGIVWSLSSDEEPVGPGVASVIEEQELPQAAPGARTEYSGSFDGTGLIDRRAWSDTDADGVPDVVEEALCGKATCAQPWDDADGDGIPDATELLACGSASCADVAVDSDVDGIPDYAGWLLCGDGGCPAGTLRADIDDDSVENWIEGVIAGNVLWADGHEDLNGNGVSDARELRQCLIDAERRLARTGFSPWLWLFVAVELVGLGVLARTRATTAGREHKS